MRSGRERIGVTGWHKVQATGEAVTLGPEFLLRWFEPAATSQTTVSFRCGLYGVREWELRKRGKGNESEKTEAEARGAEGKRAGLGIGGPIPGVCWGSGLPLWGTWTPEHPNDSFQMMSPKFFEGRHLFYLFGFPIVFGTTAAGLGSRCSVL